MIYVDMHYMAVLKSINTNSLSFDCNRSSTFLQSIISDGYDEILKLSNEDKVSRVRGGLTSDMNTGLIHIDGRNMYGRIHVHKYTSDKFGVDIELKADKDVTMDQAACSNAYLNAINKMSGKCLDHNI